MLERFGKKRKRATLTEVLRGCEPPTFPHGVMRLLQLLRDADTDIADIGTALNWDPGLVVRVLRMVNSSAFGLRNKIDQVQHAVAILGRSKLEQLVLGIAVKDSLPRTPARGFDAERFWQTAFFRASMARAIAGEIHPAEQARSFTSGLLQDMAVPLLAHARPDDYGEVLEAWHASPDGELHVLERSALGWSHDEIGGQMAEEWGLPETLTRDILAHHDAGSDGEDLPPALRLVAVHRETEREHGIHGMVEEARAYGLDPDWLLGLVQTSEQQAGELSRAL